MNVKLKIALRYIFPKGKFDFISIITIVSIVGIAIGVAALIIVMSIFNGLRTSAEGMILDIDPAIRIVSSEGAYFMIDSVLIKKINSLHGIKSVNPTLQTKAVLVKDANIEIVELISNSVGLLDEKLFIYGDNMLEGNEIVVGIALDDRLKGTLFDTLLLISMNSLKNSFNTLQLPSGLEVFSKGIIQMSIKEYDLTNCYANYNVVRQILNVSDGMISHLDIFLTTKNSKNIEKTTTLINEILIKHQAIEHTPLLKKTPPKKYIVQTWIDLNKDLYAIMQMERIAVFCVVSLILLIAMFNVFASLALTVMEKKQEISLLKALGAENNMITHIYIIEGAIIGIIGTAIGLLIGIGFVLAQIHFNLFELDSNAYITSSFPIRLDLVEVLVVCVFSLFLSVLAAYFPAKVATKQIHNIRLYNE